jgi:formimidoylglutamate deiminase
MTRRYHLDTVLLETGWRRDVIVTVTDDGVIGAVERDAAAATGAQAAATAERIAGIVIPGMPNAHSHAFQRAMAGTAEYRVGSGDSFWTWRDAMYRLANELEPAALQGVATQLFIEMLKSGYTSVAEFHYLNRQRDGRAYAGANALWEAIRAAADTAGIGLTLLPTLYQASDFGGVPLKAEQRRFALDTEAFVEAIAAQRHREPAGSTAITGAAFHSLRAVPLPSLRAATAALRALDARLPLHIHVAEQRREVESCRAATGRRPIELLLDTGLLDAHWCLVHATHATPAEIRGIAASGAAVCVSISTEANLGDGLFSTSGFLRAGGRLCVGSDSQSTVDPAEELRWLEYQQRLRRKGRAVLATRRESHVGTRLWVEAAAAGAQALGQPVGSLGVGRRADWLVLDPDHPALAGANLEGTLDHVIFAGADRAIRDVMVAGRWVLRNGYHAAEAAAQHEFAALLRASRRA